MSSGSYLEDLGLDISVPSVEAVAPPVETVKAPPTGMQSVLDQIMAGMVDPADGLAVGNKGLLYGPPGIGKTVFAANYQGTLIIDTEGGTKTLKKPSHAEVNGKAKILPYTTTANLVVVIDNIAAGNLPQCKHLVIDTMNMLQRKDLAALPLNKVGEADNLASFQNISAIVRKLNELSIAVTVITHSDTFKDKNTGAVMETPDLTPKILSAFIGMVDWMGYMSGVETDGVVTSRSLRVAPARGIMAKNRLNLSEDVLTNPNISTLIEA